MIKFTLVAALLCAVTAQVPTAAEQDRIAGRNIIRAVSKTYSHPMGIRIVYCRIE